MAGLEKMVSDLVELIGTVHEMTWQDWRRERPRLPSRRFRKLRVQAHPGLLTVRMTIVQYEDVDLAQPDGQPSYKAGVIGHRKNRSSSRMRMEPFVVYHRRRKDALSYDEQHHRATLDCLDDLAPPPFAALHIGDVLPDREAPPSQIDTEDLGHGPAVVSGI